MKNDVITKSLIFPFMDHKRGFDDCSRFSFPYSKSIRWSFLLKNYKMLLYGTLTNISFCVVCKKECHTVLETHWVRELNDDEMFTYYVY